MKRSERHKLVIKMIGGILASIIAFNFILWFFFFVIVVVVFVISLSSGRKWRTSALKKIFMILQLQVRGSYSSGYYCSVNRATEAEQLLRAYWSLILILKNYYSFQEIGMVASPCWNLYYQLESTESWSFMSLELGLLNPGDILQDT